MVSERRVIAPDGIELFVRVFGATVSPSAGDRVPVLCLPGLTRNSRDFVPLAEAVAPQRPVAAVDFRGRGYSGYDPTGDSYLPDVYASDMVAVLDELAIAKACLIGTSLGGSVSMLVAELFVDRVAGIVLNDVGPELPTAGFARIQSYAGKLPPVATWDEAVAQLRRHAEAAAPGQSDGEWEARARQQYRELEPGVIRPDHDPRIVAGLDAVDPTRIPDTWDRFDALLDVPMLVIRGALSDLFASSTVEEMRRRKPDLRTLEVENRGHPATLDEPECREAITGFLATLDPVAAAR